MAIFSITPKSKRRQTRTPSIDLLHGKLPDVPVKRPRKKPQRRAKMALMIPAHNEELMIGNTIRSAIAAGQDIADIYLVDDGSTDRTGQIARSLLGASHVLRMANSGKAAALQAGFDHFQLRQRYVWVHIADADCYFGADYFKTFKRGLRRNYVAATGFVQSLPGGWVSKFRVYEYTFGQVIMRRLQQLLGSITVIPGPSSCFRTDIFNRLNLQADCITEDFDITLQIHRQKLGRIGYIPAAKTYTQDPSSLRDYCRQISRWHRGFFQGILNNRVGLHFQRIDLYLGILMLEMMIYYLEILVIYPIIIVLHHQQMGMVVAQLFLIDVVSFLLLTATMAAFSKRWDIVGAFPLYYLLRLVQMVIFLKAFVEVVIIRRHRHNKTTWQSPQRHYQPIAKVSP